MSTVVISSEVVLGQPLWVPADAIPVYTIIEFDVPLCQLVYGESPCTAALGVTGDKKCFNSRATCQDLPNFDPMLFTYRFTRPSAQIHRDNLGDVIPSVHVVRAAPQLLNPGGDMGKRESVTVTFGDHPHSDAGIDPYLADRDYDAFEQGTFWGKLRARYPSLRGLPLRIYRGELGQPLEDGERWHYVIESGTLSGHTFSIVGKDHLKLLDGDRAQAPRISRGSLADAITDSSGSLDLVPVGIGDIDYPASGKVAIGGNEIVSFTRSGDVLTLTARGESGTDPQEHAEGDRVQLVLEYSSEPVEALILDLLTGYTAIDPGWIDYDEWQLEVGTIVNQLYSTEIAEPTDVRVLVNELIEQVGLVMWWDARAMRVRLTALRPVASDARVIDGDAMVEETFNATEQPRKRISEVWTYFNLRNPLQRLDDPSNYASVAVSADFTADPAEPPAIKKVFSRWIGFGNLGAALRVNGLLLSRYSQPPRLFRYALYRGTDLPDLGRGSRVTHSSLQDDEGRQIERPVQIIAIEPQFDRTIVQAEEMLFAPNPDLEGVRLLVIDSDALSINLRTLHDQFYSSPESADEVRCIIMPGVVVGSTGPTVPALDVGDWPGGVDIELIVLGHLSGHGGQGGHGATVGVSAQDGGAGGTALLTGYPITVTNQGQIRGGGGGGSGSSPSPSLFIGPGGGGGAGMLPGTGGISGGQNGTQDVGGGGGTQTASGTTRDGGSGGDPGEAGTAADFGGATGGAAGAAVDGESLVTYDTEGTILGPRIN